MPLNPESDCELCREDFGTCTCTTYCGAIVCLGFGEPSAEDMLEQARDLMEKAKEARKNAPKPPYTCHERGETRIVWHKRADGLEESVQFTPGFNCRDRSGKGHGVHGMEVWWLLRGPAGAAQFMIYTDWIPGELSPGHGLSPDGSRVGMSLSNEPMYPMGADLGFHARRAQYDDQEPISDDCAVIGGPCYYDGSGLQAQKLTSKFVVEGEHVIWEALENVYSDLACADFEAAFDEKEEE